MSKRVAGVAYIKADGAQFDISGGIELPISTVTREPIMGLTGPAGFKETAQEPYTKLTAIYTPDFPVQILTTSINMTVTSELANGKVYTLSGAYLKGTPAVNAAEGTIDLEFSGTVGVWQ